MGDRVTSPVELSGLLGEESCIVFVGAEDPVVPELPADGAILLPCIVESSRELLFGAPFDFASSIKGAPLKAEATAERFEAPNGSSEDNLGLREMS